MKTRPDPINPRLDYHRYSGRYFRSTIGIPALFGTVGISEFAYGACGHFSTPLSQAVMLGMGGALIAFMAGWVFSGAAQAYGRGQDQWPVR